MKRLSPYVHELKGVSARSAQSDLPFCYAAQRVLISPLVMNPRFKVTCWKLTTSLVDVLLKF